LHPKNGITNKNCALFRNRAQNLERVR